MTSDQTCPGCQHPRSEHDGDECLDSCCQCPLDLNEPSKEEK